jgi:hypothetical protein
MKALVTKGKYKGQTFEVSQWCNDWVSLENGQVVSPTQLAFKAKDFRVIREHKNNGLLFGWFEVKLSPSWCESYIYTFKKRKF